MNFTTSEENYLKAIFHLQEKHGTVTTNALAKDLQARAASVTDMMKKLSAKKLLHYKPYYGFTLSAEGKRIALHIIRRHRLWEYFLAEKLHFGWNEVHSLAEELEHVSSRELTDRLDAFLNYPAFDPHGDPIPNSKGKIRTMSKLPLSDLALQEPAEVCHVTNQTEEMLELLQHRQIEIGSKVEVKKRFGFDGSMEIKVKGQVFTISRQLATSIYVKRK